MSVSLIITKFPVKYNKIAYLTFGQERTILPLNYGETERWQKIRWGRFCLIAVLLYIAALTIPYVQHKKVSDHYKKQFDPQECYSEEPGKERAAYITDNTEALEYRLKMIREAKEEVIVSTFDFNADTGGKDVMSALIEAAHRNVHVRLIVDGMSGLQSG